MGNSKGFTLIEMIVVMIMVGVLAAFALPGFFTSIEQTNAQTAENNLLSMGAAQQKYFEDYGFYCTKTGGPGNSPITCGDNASDLNANLHLSLSTNDRFFHNYSCSVYNTTSYTCTAGDGTDTLIFNPTPTPPTPATCLGQSAAITSGCSVSCNGPNSECPSNIS